MQGFLHKVQVSLFSSTSFLLFFCLIDHLEWIILFAMTKTLRNVKREKKEMYSRTAALLSHNSPFWGCSAVNSAASVNSFALLLIHVTTCGKFSAIKSFECSHHVVGLLRWPWTPPVSTRRRQRCCSCCPELSSEGLSLNPGKHGELSGKTQLSDTFLLLPAC